jgi:uncharacterized protein with HEPN domain
MIDITPKKIVEDIKLIWSYSKRVDFSDPSLNGQALDAINFRMIQIRESIAGFSPEFIKNHPEIDFDGIVGFRNLITHDYGHVDYSVYKKMIEVDLSDIEKKLVRYLK